MEPFYVISSVFLINTIIRILERKNIDRLKDYSMMMSMADWLNGHRRALYCQSEAFLSAVFLKQWLRANDWDISRPQSPY